MVHVHVASLRQLYQSSMRNCYLQPSCPSNDKINATWSPRKGLCSLDRILAQRVVFCSEFHCLQSSTLLC